MAGAAGAGAGASWGGSGSRRTGKTFWHFEQRTFTPRGPTFSSATRNFAWHCVHVTIIRPSWSDVTPWTA
jgi:hypothetical protein